MVLKKDRFKEVCQSFEYDFEAIRCPSASGDDCHYDISGMKDSQLRKVFLELAKNNASIFICRDDSVEPFSEDKIRV